MTHSVSLRDVTKEDLPLFYDHQLDPEATRMAAFPARARDAFITHWTSILADETAITKTILFEGQVAGNVVSWLQSGERRVGYWLGQEFWGRGIATEALTQFLDHVTVRPLYAYVAKHNIASLRVLEKCGFTISGEDNVSFGAQAVEEFILKLEGSSL